MPQFCPNLDVISKQNKKKGLHGKMPPFSQDFDAISEKKRSSRKNVTIFSELRCDLKKRKGLPSSTSWFLNVISMGLLKSTSPMRATLKPMGPLKSMGPEVIVPPSRRPWLWWLTAQTALGYNSTKPKFKTNYARNQISKQKNYWFYLRNIRIRKCASLNPARIA